MTIKQKTEFKERLMQNCIAIIEQRINSASVAMENAQSAANNEEKSSAGDKYETTRSMNQLEKEMYSKQLAANQKEREALFAIDHRKLYDTVVTGCVVQCKKLSFFIAAGLGKIAVDGDTVFLVSPNAPVSNSLKHKKTGDLILFNKEEMEIIDIF